MKSAERVTRKLSPEQIAKAREARAACRRVPVSSLSQLYMLDPAEIAEGYHDAREGLGCGDNRSRAYWHGWRNGMVDSGRAEPDWALRLLAREIVTHWGGPSEAFVRYHDEQFRFWKEIGLA